MAVDERRRHLLYRRLEEVLGPDEAGTLMDHLPPVGWADVARRSDIEALRREFIGALGSEIGSVRQELGSEIGSLRQELGSEIASLRREMEHMEDRLTNRFDAKLEPKLNSQTKTLVGLMTAQVVAIAGLAFAAARLA